MIRTGSSSHVLQHVESEKDLGVTFDSSLAFDVDIHDKINKANGIFAMIRRSYKYLTKRNVSSLIQRPDEKQLRVRSFGLGAI